MAPEPELLSAAELKFLSQAWASAKVDLINHIDLEKLSKLAGHSNLGSAQELLGQITKKLKESERGVEGKPPSTPASTQKAAETKTAPTGEEKRTTEFLYGSDGKHFSRSRCSSQHKWF